MNEQIISTGFKQAVLNYMVDEENILSCDFMYHEENMDPEEYKFYMASYLQNNYFSLN